MEPHFFEYCRMFNSDMEATCRECGEGYYTVPHLKAAMEDMSNRLLRYELRLMPDIDCETGASIDEIDRLTCQVQVMQHDNEVLRRKVRMLSGL